MDRLDGTVNRAKRILRWKRGSTHKYDQIVLFLHGDYSERVVGGGVGGVKPCTQIFITFATMVRVRLSEVC